MIRENGKVRLVEIGKLMDFMIDNYWKPEGYECLAFNKDGEISWQKIDAFVKHEIHSELLKVKLEKGREVEITKSHSVFTVREGKIKEILGKDLMENQRASRENCVPKSFLSLSMNSNYVQKGRIRNKNSVSVATIEKWIGRIGEDVIDCDCPDFLLKDLTVLKIRKIKRRKFHGFVYDFAVKDLQNFIGGYGGVCLHNTGEGGVLVTDNEELARLARSMRNQGRGERGGWLDHERLGYNFRMDELSVALGCSQMERIEEIFAAILSEDVWI